MALGTYVDTYKAYKAGTSKITTWLVDNARKCGVEVQTSTGEATGTTTSKGSKTGKYHQIKLKEFTRLAKAIATSEEPKIRLPKSIAALVLKVIGLRKKAADFFTNIAGSRISPKIEKANAGHRHFIAVLEETLSLLQADSEPSIEPDLVETTNIFEVLTIEEPSSSVEGPVAATKTRKSVTAVEYELETSHDDIIFAVLTLFHDVNDIRAYLQDLWRDFKDGKIDMMSAAVTTDTAFNILRRTSEEVVQSLPGNPSYPIMLMLLREYFEDMDVIDSIDFADWTCLSTANVLNSYEDVLSASHVPVYKPGHFGLYNPAQDRTKLTPKAQAQEDLIILMELLPEFTKLTLFHADLPVRDELTSAMAIMMETRSMEKLPMFAIFAMQILLDIHHVLRQDVSRPFDQLQATARRVVETIDGWLRYSRNRHIANWPPQNDSVFQRIKSDAQYWALEDQLAIATAKVKVAGAKIKPPRFHLLKNHPVLSGLMIFRLNLLVNDGGITLCNAWGSVLYPAHFYNACRRSADLEEVWDDMEYMISVHTPTRLFVGTPPTEPADYLKRFLLALGASASIFARNRRPGGPSLIPESKKGPRGLKTTSPIKDIFFSRYVDGGSAQLSVSNIVAMVAVASKAVRTSPPSVDMTDFTRKVMVQKHYPTIELLQAVREGVAGAEIHLLFDYFGLQQRCLKLLRGVQTHVHADLVRYFGEQYIDDESQLPYVVGYIFEVVAGSDRIAEQLRVGNHGSRLLHTAARELSTFLQDESGSRGIAAAKELSSSILRA